MKHVMSTALTVAAIAACTGLAAAQHAIHSGAEVGGMHSRVHKIKLDAQNNSGESGYATLQQTPDGLIVKVFLTGGTGDQPAHIHKGTCASLDPKPAFPLDTVTDGTSTTTIKDETLWDIWRGTYAINVHKSTDDLTDYVACGDIFLSVK